MFTKRHAETEYHRYLRQVPLFTSLSNTELDAVGRATTVLRFEPGKTLVREGSRAFEMMIVTRGAAEVTREGRHVATIVPGDVLGELAVLAPGPRSATATATTDVELLHITADRFAQLLSEVPAIAPKLLAVIAARVTDDETTMEMAS